MTGSVVDGHLRVQLALERHELSVPVTYVELTEDEERLILATLDPLTAMAEAETEALAALLAGLEPEDDALRALLDDLARDSGIDALGTGLVDPDEVPEPPAEPYSQGGATGGPFTAFVKIKAPGAIPCWTRWRCREMPCCRRAP